MERYLTEADKASLVSYAAKCEQLKAYTLAVIRGTQTGLLLFGSGGNGKSFSIRQTLNERNILEVQPQQAKDNDEEEDDPHKPAGPLVDDYKSFVCHSGRITAKGLIQEMANYPKSIHLIEDAETMFDDKNCWGVLRMSLHSQDHALHSSRRITWKTSVDVIDFYFSGSLVIVGNRLMDSNKEEVKAVETRCPCVLFDINEAEMIAKMKELCEKGYDAIPAAPLSKSECYDVLAMILESRTNDPKLQGTKLNFRILISGFRFTALQKLEPSIDWRSMLMGQMAKEIRGGKSKRKDRIYDEKQLAADIEAKRYPNVADKLAAWCKAVNRNLDWWNHPKTSKDYKKGYEAARKDLQRKSK